ncbi:hypothetical protein CAPN002_21410 [Capnocytophaga stomatis]|uniref:pentapeptide repeat-containing protein n=1 Tax=Capnocytophaga stomatis TaxID=1848904 RepID=UPI001950E4B3|nr:pentapeptide repeat-containing protein [Capnocytophaga stomatis]GIJ94923.1 hypothetical protein CAPN002_21410 [Capnocytophaga stomatis]
MKKFIFFSSVYFLKSHFLHSTKFWKVKFSSLAYFIEALFYSETNFNHSKFENIVDFSNAIFKKEIQFYSTSFLDRAIFSYAFFEQETQFLYCKVISNTFLTFEGANFKKSLDISRSNFHYSNLRFWNIKIEGDENLSQYEKYINDFKDTNKIENKDKKYQKLRPSLYAKIRETYRIIKNAFYKEDNRIEGLEFYKREMAVYEKELKEKSFWHKDRFMLLLNKISNNYGTSWSRGLLFTITVAFIFYLCILISLHNSLEWDIRSLDAWDNFLKHFLEVINVTRWKDIEPFGVELNGLAYLFLFIGRIFIGYGYYQTIQAFRKYGKSS